MTRWSVHFVWAGVLLLIVVFSRAESSPAPTEADTPQTKVDIPAQTKIAVVNIAQVFKSSSSFDDQMKKMKAKVDAAEVKVKDQQEELKKLAERQKDESTPEDERAALERRLAERQAILTSEIAIQKQ